MNNITLIIVRDDGSTYRIDNTQWGILELTGFDRPSISVYTEKRALDDGDIVTGQRVEAREIEMKLEARSSGQNDTLRRFLLSYFRPTGVFDVYIQRYGEMRYAPDCKITDIDVPTDRLSAPITVSLTFLCPGGYLMGAAQASNPLSSVTPTIGYPYISVLNYTPFGSYEVRSYGIWTAFTSKNITNDGDVEAFCRIVLEAKGAVVNPKVYVNDNYIKLITTLAAGDIVVIDPQNLTVRKNGARIMNTVATGSALAKLKIDPGGGVIRYSADSGAGALVVTEYHNERYMGA